MTNLSAIATADAMLENKEMRENLITRLDVLEKVKSLFLIPGIEMMTMKQVAEFYEVTQEALRKCYARNRDEVDGDGVKVLTGKGLLLGHNVPVVQKNKGSLTFSDENGNTFDVSNAPTTFFSKRAVLRIGMLLRDSVVAQEVRNQLLNTFQTTTESQRTDAIDEETSLLMAVVNSGDKLEIALALGEYKRYKERYQHELEAANADLEQRNEKLDAENDAYSREIMLWSDRAILEKLMRIYAGKRYVNMPYAQKATLAWGAFYDELYLGFRISLAARRKGDENAKKKYLDYLEVHEWPIAVKVAYGMCRRRNYDILAAIGNDVVFERILECDESAIASSCNGEVT